MTTSAVEPADAPVKMTSGLLRSMFLMAGVPSIFESFRDRETTLIIPHTAAAAPTTKVRSLPAFKKDITERAQAAAIADAQQVVVDLGPYKKGSAGTTSNFSVVFTTEPDDGECWHCRRQVKPHMKVGIPLRARDDRFHHSLIVDIEGRACNAKCALKFIQDHVGQHMCFEGRVTVMHQINEVCNPGTKLVAAPDFRLLKKYEGPLTDEEFDADAHTFAPMPCLQFRVANLAFARS